METTNKKSPETKWLNEKQVAARLNVKEATLQNWRWRRVGLPYSKFMRSVRYKESDLYAYMEAGRIEPENQLNLN
jgi:hypothetical protein